MKNIAIFTIISKNYIAYARVFTESLLKQHPNIKAFVLLVDEMGDHINPKKEIFEIIEVSKIGIRNFNSFAFKYNILELNTAVKPFFIEYLFKKYKFGKILYFDPDILVTNNLNKLFKILGRHSILLIPHITKPINDGCKPDEIDFLKSGSYNLGFIGLANTKTTKNFLKWWQDRVYDNCLYDVQHGLFVDQKWIDLVPSLFNDYYILYDPGYNVAYWNLHERNIISNGRNIEDIKVNKKPLYFFHFSGFDPDRISLVSKHQTRFSLEGNARHLKDLFEVYGKLLYEKGFKESRRWPYLYGSFDNGVKICDFIRRIYLSLPDKKKAMFGDPFSSQKKNSFYEWLNAPKTIKKDGQPYITNLLYELYESRDDLKVVFPDVLNKDKLKFMEWVKYQGRYELNLDKELLKSLEGRLESGSFIRNFIRRTLNIFLYHQLVQKNKFVIKRFIGSGRYYGVRNFLNSVSFGFSRDIGHTTNRSYLKRLPISRSGVNVAGHITAESGTGEAVRSAIKCIRSVNVPLEINNFEINVYRREDKTFKNFTSYNPYRFNLICINAEQSDTFYRLMGKGYFQEKYNIGYWLWEQSIFPNEWLDRFKYFDEVWTASSFSQEAISKKSPIPVLKIPLAIDSIIQTKYDRKYFSLPKDKFIFLFVFDFLSVFERKNPLAVIDAFKKMLASSPNALLVLKAVNYKYNLKAFQNLKEGIRNLPIKLIDKYLSRTEVNSIINACDCYVSLHRSEGFGYTMFEAMYWGKPVIATAYSGNMDIMNINNSFLVKYKIIELDRDYGVYRKGTTWVEPDIDHAAALMEFVYKNPDRAKIVGDRASKDVISQLDVKTVGEVIKNRLQVIGGIS